MKEYQRLTKRTTTDENNKNWYGTEVSRVTILNRLGELEDKIQNGTLIELPCKPGQDVWFVDVQQGTFKKFIDKRKGKVSMFHIRLDGSVGMVVDFGKYSHEFRKDNTLPNTLFFDEEQAEERLKELKGEL